MGPRFRVRANAQTYPATSSHWRMLMIVLLLYLHAVNMLRGPRVVPWYYGKEAFIEVAGRLFALHGAVQQPSNLSGRENTIVRCHHHESRLRVIDDR